MIIENKTGACEITEIGGLDPLVSVTGEIVRANSIKDKEQGFHNLD